MFKLIETAPLGNLIVGAMHCELIDHQILINVEDKTVFVKPGSDDSNPYLSGLFNRMRRVNIAELGDDLIPWATLNRHPAADRFLVGACNENYVAINNKGIWTRTGPEAPYCQIGQWTTGLIAGHQIDYNGFSTPPVSLVSSIMDRYGDAFNTMKKLVATGMVGYDFFYKHYYFTESFMAEVNRWGANIQLLVRAICSASVKVRRSYMGAFIDEMGHYDTTSGPKTAHLSIEKSIGGHGWVPPKAVAFGADCVLKMDSITFGESDDSCDCGHVHGVKLDTPLTFPIPAGGLHLLYNAVQPEIVDGYSRKDRISRIANVFTDAPFMATIGDHLRDVMSQDDWVKADALCRARYESIVAKD